MSHIPRNKNVAQALLYHRGAKKLGPQAALITNPVDVRRAGLPEAKTVRRAAAALGLVAVASLTAFGIDRQLSSQDTVNRGNEQKIHQEIEHVQVVNPAAGISYEIEGPAEQEHRHQSPLLENMNGIGPGPVQEQITYGEETPSGGK